MPARKGAMLHFLWELFFGKNLTESEDYRGPVDTPPPDPFEYPNSLGNPESDDPFKSMDTGTGTGTGIIGPEMFPHDKGPTD